MYKCFNCGRRFEEPDYEDLSYEDYYGVGSEFPRAGHHYFRLKRCPYCGSDEVEEDYEDDTEE